MLNELKFRLRSLLVPSVDKYLSVLNAVVDSMDHAAEVNDERAWRLKSRAGELTIQSRVARAEALRAERIADRFRELMD